MLRLSTALLVFLTATAALAIGHLERASDHAANSTVFRSFSNTLRLTVGEFLQAPLGDDTMTVTIAFPTGDRRIPRLTVTHRGKTLSISGAVCGKDSDVEKHFRDHLQRLAHAWTVASTEALTPMVNISYSDTAVSGTIVFTPTAEDELFNAETLRQVLQEYYLQWDGTDHRHNTSVRVQCLLAHRACVWVWRPL